MGTLDRLLEYQLDHIYSAAVKLKSPAEVIGPAPEGLRVSVYISSCEITGPMLEGRVRPVGGDWLTLRTDGVGILDLRISIETHDGAVINLHLTGVGDAGESGYQNVLSGKLPARISIRAVSRHHTVHPRYRWLNRMQCLGIGEVDLERSEVRIDHYAVL